MKTTPDWRDAMRVLCNSDISINGEEQTPRSFLDLLDDFAALEAELAALRRVERDDLECARDSDGWLVELPEPRGNKRAVGRTLAEALANFDAKVETTR